MADTRKNNKAPLLDAYFEKEGLHFFQKRPLGDGEDTAVYLTAIPAAGHRLLTAVLTDSSIYANIRCHLGGRAWGKADDGAYLEFLRKLNAAHAFFKYAANQQGGLYVDICIPARDDHFERAAHLRVPVFRIEDDVPLRRECPLVFHEAETMRRVFPEKEPEIRLVPHEGVRLACESTQKPMRNRVKRISIG